MKLYDISVPISADMPVWPGDPRVCLDCAASIRRGDPCNCTMIAMGAHTGTHIDAPFHYFEEGSPVDAIPLEVLVGRCSVIEVRSDSVIERKDLGAFCSDGCSRILLKTRNSTLWRESPRTFRENFVSLGLSGAEYLAEKGVLLVGVDYLSVESYHADERHPVHRILLEKNIVILEGVDLSDVPPGDYELICLPIKIQGTDGAPVRAILRETSSILENG